MELNILFWKYEKVRGGEGEERKNEQKWYLSMLSLASDLVTT